MKSNTITISIQNLEKHIKFLALTESLAAIFSKDPSTKVGSIIVDKNFRIVSAGYNGYPQKIEDTNLNDRIFKYNRTIHAEENAILFSKCDLSEYTIYVYPFAPCLECMKIIIQSGITQIVFKIIEEKYRPNFKFDLSLQLAKEANISLFQFDKDNNYKYLNLEQ